MRRHRVRRYRKYGRQCRGHVIAIYFSALITKYQDERIESR